MVSIMTPMESQIMPAINNRPVLGTAGFHFSILGFSADHWCFPKSLFGAWADSGLKTSYPSIGAKGVSRVS